jgi:hypothetical protein
LSEVLENFKKCNIKIRYVNLIFCLVVAAATSLYIE